MIEDLLALPNAKLHVIMNSNIKATVSIERDINTLAQFDNIFDLCNELLKTSNTHRKKSIYNAWRK